MTMVAINVQRDAVEMMTDSLSYTLDLDEIRDDEKKLLWIEGQQTLFLAQGTVGFGHRCIAYIADHMDNLVSIDDTAGKLRAALPTLYRDFVAAAKEQGVWNDIDPHVAVFLAGWSPKKRRCVAYVFDETTNFAKREIREPFVLPAPYTIRQSALERRRQAAHMAPMRDLLLAAGDEAADTLAKLDRIQANLKAAPPLAAPQTLDDWRALARRVFDSRTVGSVGTGVQVPIGGDIIYGRVTKDDVELMRLGRLPVGRRGDYFGGDDAEGRVLG